VRQKKTWLHEVKEHVRSFGLCPEDAQDDSQWMKKIKAATG